MNTNATKHYDRDAFETNNSGNDLHGRGANQPNGDLNTNATKHYDRDAFETNNFEWRKSNVYDETLR